MLKKILFAIMILAALSACGKKATETKEQKGAAVAKVGNVVITESDLEREMKALPDYAQQMFKDESGREKFIDELVKKEMLYQEAVKKGLDKTPDFLTKVEEFKKLTLVSGLLEKEIMSASKPTDQEVKDYYDKHKQEFSTTSQIKASHILVKTEEAANKILERLAKGEKFEAIATKESIDKGSAKNGGDLGFFSRGQMVPEFEKAAASLKPGEISRPVKTSFGYHIIKVTDKKAGPVIEFERIKDLISQKISGERQKEAFDKYMAELKKNYKVELMNTAAAKPQEGAADKTGLPAGEPKDAEKKEEPAQKEEPKPKPH